MERPDPTGHGESYRITEDISRGELTGCRAAFLADPHGIAVITAFVDVGAGILAAIGMRYIEFFRRGRNITATA